MILPLESQVCSLDSAKRLKELGCPQESLFYWTFDEGYSISQSRVSLFGQPIYSAYTVAELAEMIPSSFDLPKKEMVSTIGKEFPFVWIYKEGIKQTEAEARAQMLINIVEFQINSREKIPDLGQGCGSM